MVKKNRVSVYGKTFHLTSSGKIFPLGKKKNWFTDCMSGLAGSLAKAPAGGRLSPVQIQSNKDAFGAKVAQCKSLGIAAPKKKGK